MTTVLHIELFLFLFSFLVFLSVYLCKTLHFINKKKSYVPKKLKVKEYLILCGSAYVPLFFLLVLDAKSFLVIKQIS